MILAALLVGALLVLSIVLTITTLLPGVGSTAVLVTLATILVAAVVALAVTSPAHRPDHRARYTSWERATWTTPQLETLAPPVLTRPRAIALVALRCYLMIAAVMLVVKVAESTVR